ncbi:hypothetical protein P691DRAFT_767662 [Macrolepiota fuliginosa MF-IS2]|uniref:Uncharacterized protein n=1 Tax=Macrolepiota fuliginosa MF-IS2 TaxID=1400762 RepID=A0A9P6BWG3_9AGAR|nr:hypothetical protein P691DRAFT_767662 [Macrolepiota fuliginosa MF-IS2]
MASKQLRKYGLANAELTSAVVAPKASVEKERQEWVLNAAEDEAEDEAELTQLGSPLQMLQSKVDGPQAYLSPGMITDHLEKLDISWSGSLELNLDVVDRAVETDSHGKDRLWSADMLYEHLQFLDNLVQRKNEAAARLWIDAFFYRVATMIPGGLNMVLSVEQDVPSVTVSDKSLFGYVSWTAIVTSPEKSQMFLHQPALQSIKSEDSAFVVSEAKGSNCDLKTHVPQALFEMLGCARHSGKLIMRGVVTNGRRWIFLILMLNKDGGGSYLESSELHINQAHTTKIFKQGVSLISSIIAHWMMHSHEAFNADNDFFTLG